MRSCYMRAQGPSLPKLTTDQTRNKCNHLQGPFQGHSRQAIPSNHHRRLVNSSRDQETRISPTSPPYVRHSRQTKHVPIMVPRDKATRLAAAAAVHTRHPHKHQVRHLRNMWGSSLLVQ